MALPDPLTGAPRVTAVVAEDEALLRDELVAQLRRAWPGLDIIAVCEDGEAAATAIRAAQPDVAFLDIRMPGMTGLEVAAAAARISPRTQVVFVTAYDEHAVAAFEQGAVDYLLKPVDAGRLAATVARLRQRGAVAPADLCRLLDVIDRLHGAAPRAAAPELAWITASCGRETRLIPVDDVIYFRADHKYTVVVTAEGEALIRTPLRELVPGLDPNRFAQVHRGTIVNLRAIEAIVREDSGRGTIKLKQRAETLAVSVSFMPLFRNM